MERNQRAKPNEDPNTKGNEQQHSTDRDNVRTAQNDKSQKMSDVVELSERVTNVTLEEVSDTDTADTADEVSNTSIQLPQREVRARPTRTKSATSFVSCPSTPCDSGMAIPKSVRPITTFFTPIHRTPAPTGSTSTRERNSDNVTVTSKPRPTTPNILEGLISDEDTAVSRPVMTSSQAESEDKLRGSKRKRIVSAATNNYEVVGNNPLNTNNAIQPMDMDDLSKELFEESGRPAITITSRVSDNRSTDHNGLSVSFQIPAQTPDQGAAAAEPTPTYTPFDVSKGEVDPGTPWMKTIEQDYYNTARSSVVAEVRAKHRSRMLCDLTNQGLIAPWALQLAPMPVYLHPHADKIAEMMKKQALDLQIKIADMLHDHAAFQAEKIQVDKSSLQKIFGENKEGYRLSVGALFDARLKVQMDIKEQMGKYIQHLAMSENQVPDKDLISTVRGLVPKKYNTINAMELPTAMDPPSVDRQSEARPIQERSRARSRSRSRRRGRSSSRPAKRRNFQQDQDYGFGRQQQQQQQQPPNNNNYNNYPQRQPPQGSNSYNNQGARPKQPQQGPPKMAMEGVDPRLFTPDLIRKIAEAYDGLHK